MSSRDDTDEQLVRALVGIGAELTRIRRVLEAEYDAPANDGDAAFTCRSCDATFAAEGAAYNHAQREHGAPPGHETDLIE